MKVTEHIHKAQKSGKTVFSLEILPPLKGQNIDDVFQNIEPMMEFEPPFIDITYHREEYLYSKSSTGGYERKAIKKRPGTLGICAAILHKYGVDTVPHILAGGFTIQETENFLIDLQYIGIDSVLALRGDPVKGESEYHPKKGGHFYANELVEQINSLNKGQYLSSPIEHSYPTNFDIGVAAYPEVHLDAPSAEADLQNLKRKVDAGAHYIVTQMFFDNQKYKDFVKKCRKIDISVPIIPGIKPIATLNHLNILPKIFHLELPEALRKEVAKAKTNSQVRQIGVEWSIQQSKDLIQFGAPGVHYYSMGKSDNIVNIAKEVF